MSPNLCPTSGLGHYNLIVLMLAVLVGSGSVLGADPDDEYVTLFFDDLDTDNPQWDYSAPEPSTHHILRDGYVFPIHPQPHLAANTPTPQIGPNTEPILPASGQSLYRPAAALVLGGIVRRGVAEAIPVMLLLFPLAGHAQPYLEYVDDFSTDTGL